LGGNIRIKCKSTDELQTINIQIIMKEHAKLIFINIFLFRSRITKMFVANDTLFINFIVSENIIRFSKSPS